MSASVKITVTQIEALRVRLAATPPPPPRPNHAATKMEAVVALSQELTALREKGWGLQALAALLAEGGVAVSPGTLRNYLQRAGATRRRRRRRVDNASTAGTQATPPGALTSDAPSTVPSVVPIVERTGAASAVARIGSFTVREDTEL
jgi:hypothetical protein